MDEAAASAANLAAEPSKRRRVILFAPMEVTALVMIFFSFISQ